jgi:CubicO group peptidase (beta-lactamase class C family)
MFSTVGDLLRLGSSLLDAGPPSGQAGGSPRVLTHRVIESMSRSQLEGVPHIGPDGAVTQVQQAVGWRKPAGEWPARPSAITHGGISGARLWVDRGSNLVFALLTNRWDAPDGPAAAILDHVYDAMEQAGV